MMDADERDIFYYLRNEPDTFVPGAAIFRQAGGRRKFREDQEWARGPLMRMVERGILEVDATGAYRLRPVPRTQQAQRWISPQFADILRKKGKNILNAGPFSGDDEEYYNNL
jgi:hypothetical protein